MSRSPGSLVSAAAGGDQQAWDALVDEFASLVWNVARAHRLSHADAADVSQTVWLRLVEHLGRLRDPERVAGWLATTARNECLAVLRRGGREALPGDETPAGSGPAVPAADLRLLTEERDTALWQAYSRISQRCQALLRLVLADPPLGYDEISALLDMPTGSIGPTRGRCLRELRRQLDIAGISGAP